MLTPADHELFAFAASNDSVFTLADAAAAGLTEPEVRRRAAHLWERVHAGVFRVPGAAPSWHGELRAAVLAGGERAAASHRSAAALYGLPGARRDFVEVIGLLRECGRDHGDLFPNDFKNDIDVMGGAGFAVEAGDDRAGEHV